LPTLEKISRVIAIGSTAVATGTVTAAGSEIATATAT
jgi:hypothetical protein